MYQNVFPFVQRYEGKVSTLPVVHRAVADRTLNQLTPADVSYRHIGPLVLAGFPLLHPLHLLGPVVFDFLCVCHTQIYG